MATNTPNNNLKKPDGSDYVLVSDFNRNSDIVDAAIGNLAQLSTPTKTSLVQAINEAAQTGGGNSPYLNEETGTWWEWDAATAQYVDTGTRAEGPEGEKGDEGNAATIAAGSTTTAPPSTPASVSNSGTQHAAVFDFIIPRGETGAGMQILDRFPTEAALRTAHPTGTPGDAYEVGNAIPYDVWRWSETQNDWYNSGQVGGGSGTVTSWNNIAPDENGNVEADSGNLPYDASAETPVSTKAEIDSVRTLAASKASPSTIITATLSAPWTDNQQTIEDPAIKADTSVTVHLAQSATAIQAAAFTGAQIRPTTCRAEDGSISLSSPNPPGIDIPVELLLQSGDGTVRVGMGIPDILVGKPGGIASLDGNMKLAQMQPNILSGMSKSGALTLLNGITGSLGCTNAGGIVLLSGNVIFPANAVDGTQIAVIPQQFRPSSLIYFNPTTASGSPASMAIRIYTSGSVNVFGSPSSGLNYLLYLMYICGG